MQEKEIMEINNLAYSEQFSDAEIYYIEKNDNNENEEIQQTSTLIESSSAEKELSQGKVAVLEHKGGVSEDWELEYSDTSGEYYFDGENVRGPNNEIWKNQDEEMHTLMIEQWINGESKEFFLPDFEVEENGIRNLFVTVLILNENNKVTFEIYKYQDFLSEDSKLHNTQDRNSDFVEIDMPNKEDAEELKEKEHDIFFLEENSLREDESTTEAEGEHISEIFFSGYNLVETNKAYDCAKQEVATDILYGILSSETTSDTVNANSVEQIDESKTNNIKKKYTKNKIKENYKHNVSGKEDSRKVKQPHNQRLVARTYSAGENKETLITRRKGEDIFTENRNNNLKNEDNKHYNKTNGITPSNKNTLLKSFNIAERVLRNVSRNEDKKERSQTKSLYKENYKYENKKESAVTKIDNKTYKNRDAMADNHIDYKNRFDNKNEHKQHGPNNEGKTFIKNKKEHLNNPLKSNPTIERILRQRGLFFLKNGTRTNSAKFFTSSSYQQQDLPYEKSKAGKYHDSNDEYYIMTKNGIKMKLNKNIK